MQNNQAQEAGKHADEIIKRLANPSDAIETDKTEVEATDNTQEAEQPVKTDPVPVDNYEERFKRYKASTDKTIYELRQQVTHLQSVESENETLKTQLAEAKSAIPSTPSELLESFSQSEVDAFQKMVDGQVGDLKSEITRLKAELEDAATSRLEDTKKNKNSEIINAVRSVVKDFDTINVDPEFVNYMGDVDQFGSIRTDLLNIARNSSPPDISRIVQFYVDFANSKAADAAPAQEGLDKQQITQKELMQNPSSTSSGSPEAPRGLGITWDQATISKLYTDKVTGHISPEKFKELEADMYRARGAKSNR